jgi:hypothetical protein
VLPVVPASGVEKLENGKWKLENRKWKLENRNWDVEDGNYREHSNGRKARQRLQGLGGVEDGA